MESRNYFLCTRRLSEIARSEEEEEEEVNFLKGKPNNQLYRENMYHSSDFQ